jgi:hypothetical protein
MSHKQFAKKRKRPSQFAKCMAFPRQEFANRKPLHQSTNCQKPTEITYDHWAKMGLEVLGNDWHGFRWAMAGTKENKQFMNTKNAFWEEKINAIRPVPVQHWDVDEKVEINIRRSPDGIFPPARPTGMIFLMQTFESRMQKNRPSVSHATPEGRIYLCLPLLR